jgi:hypothetical protein
VRVRRAQVSGEFVQCIMPDENSRRHVEHAVVRMQLLNGGTTAGGIPPAKNLLKVAVQEFSQTWPGSAKIS